MLNNYFISFKKITTNIVIQNFFSLSLLTFIRILLFSEINGTHVPQAHEKNPQKTIIVHKIMSSTFRTGSEQGK